MSLFKVNTFISMRIMPYAQAYQCIRYRVSYTVCLLVGECSCLSVATAYVRLFIVSFRTIKVKKQVCFLLFIHNVKFQLITTNKNMKKMTNSPGCLQQRLGSDCTTAKADACLYPARACFTHFDTRILDYKTSH